MAHPLTQHPPNMIGFGAPVAMSPLGFGFGQPSHVVSPIHPSFGMHSNPVSPGGVGFGFASAAAPGTVGVASSPLKRLAPPRMSPAPTPTPTTTKRSRRRSSTSSHSSSPVGSPSISRRRSRIDDTDEPADDLVRDVKPVGRLTKRSRRDVVSAATQNNEPDVGLLLASLPASSHLSILLDLLRENPTLAPRVLRNMPQLPLSNCLETLERHFAKIGKAAGSWEQQEGYVATRRWNRVEKEVTAFAKTAETYLKFYSSPPPSTGTLNAEPTTIYHLLHTITTDIVQILYLVPAGPPANARTFLDFANQVLSSWGAWVEGLSSEVNNRGGMYPASTVQAWADGLNSLAVGPSPAMQPAASSMAVSWATPMPMPSAPTATNPLVEGFHHALQPIRERFVNELGWLVSRS